MEDVGGVREISYRKPEFSIRVSMRSEAYIIEIRPTRNDSLAYGAAVCREIADSFSRKLWALDNEDAQIRSNLPSSPTTADYFTEKPSDDEGRYQHAKFILPKGGIKESELISIVDSVDREASEIVQRVREGLDKLV